MLPAASPTAATLAELRQHHYNATVVATRRIHDELAVLRVRSDAGRVPYLAGQYTTLGLGNWEPRVREAQPEASQIAKSRLIRRAYSISCQLIDTNGALAKQDEEVLEFYIALIRRATSPPALTPRLFMLHDGDRLHLGQHCHGNYTLRTTAADSTIFFFATGTGEAPHNTMIRELLERGHQGPVISVVCARQNRDFAYRRQHQILTKRFANYRYKMLTTREPQNVDPRSANFVGKVYIQDYLTSGSLETDTETRLDPRHSHVYLCGNPAMIGLPKYPRTQEQSPRVPGMIQLLTERGFHVDRPHDPGNVHFEKYW